MSGLTEQQKQDFEEKGYIPALPVFNEAEVVELNENLQHLLKLLKPGEKHFQINGWHRTSRWLYDVSSDPRILDYVESLLGPNFYLWGVHFFSKAPLRRIPLRGTRTLPIGRLRHITPLLFGWRLRM